MRRLILASLLIGCAPTVAPATVKVVVPEVVVEPVAGPRLEIRFEPLVAAPPPRLGVVLTARGIAAQEWRFAAPVGAEPRELSIRDAAGELAFGQGREGQALVVRLGRAPRGALEIRYVLHMTDGAVRAEEVPADLVLRVDNARVLAAGEEVLLLPVGVEALEVALGLVAAPPWLVGVASSLGAPGFAGRVRTTDLRHAAFLIGRLGHAVFRGPEGEDDFAWSGDTRFDLRWSAAETAGARTAVDAYFKKEPGETRRFTGLLAVDVDFAGAGGVSVHPRGGGLYVAIAPGTDWDAQARLAVAHGLVHRWIGGRLRLRGAADEPAEAGAWFAAGFARAVAREVLLDLGTLSNRDYADEVNAHHAVVATARLRGASNREVAAAAASGDADAHALSMARGVLYATRLLGLLRTRPGQTLQVLLGELVDEAQKNGVAELPIEAFTRRVEAVLGKDEVAAFTAGVLEGGVIGLPADALGPCFVRRARTYTRFDLGFDERASLAATTIQGLRADGPAARAGVRAGEPLLGLSVEPGDDRVPAEVTLGREGKEVKVTYRPRTPPGRGEGWVRRPGVDEQTCPP